MITYFCAGSELRFYKDTCPLVFPQQWWIKINKDYHGFGVDLASDVKQSQVVS